MKKLTKTTFRTLIAALLLLASVMSFACNSGSKGTTDYTPDQIARIIIASQQSTVQLESLPPDDDYYGEYLTGIYGLDASTVKDGVIYYAGGVLAEEIAVFQLNQASDTNAVKETLTGYKDKRASVFIGYAPDQSALLRDGIVVANGAYVALVVCDNSREAEKAFLACFSNDPPSLPAPTSPLENTEEAINSDNWTDSDISLGQGKNENNNSNDIKPDEKYDSSFIIPTESDTFDNNNMDNSNGSDNTQLNTDGASPDGQDKKPSDANPTDSVQSADPSDTVATEMPDGDTATNNTMPSPIPTDESTPDSDKQITSEEPPKVSSDPRDGSYDSNAIIKAWQSGDTSSLSAKNLNILNACTETIANIIDDDMSTYDKELAIHDWIIDWAGYDEEALTHSPNAKPDPDNDNPYGLLFSKKAICSGFTSTFQLFMDMLDIECISVDGESGSERDEHAWNMVKIDGSWYCVDVTWNAPIGGTRLPASRRHTYFNVTSDYMRQTTHYWDESAYPVANSGKLYFD